jgi:uncharacterized protein
VSATGTLWGRAGGHRALGGARRSGSKVLRVALAALLGLITKPVVAQTFPRFTNFVVDQAGILSPPAEARLNARLAKLQRKTRHQLAIVTVSSLQGYSINDYTLRLSRTWGVGRRRYDDGVVLLVAPREHKVRIEVGYGLEATLTDPRCAEIIRDRIVPRFKRNDFPGGIEAGADAIIARLNNAAPLEKARAS